MMTDEQRLLRAMAVLEKVEAHLKGELQRGYCLTYEPMAGQQWRQRRNELLGEVEQILRTV